MLVHTLLVTLAAAATAVAAPVLAPDAAPAPSPALAAREPTQSWWVTNDGIVDTDGDGVPDAYVGGTV